MHIIATKNCRKEGENPQKKRANLTSCHSHTTNTASTPRLTDIKTAALSRLAGPVFTSLSEASIYTAWRLMPIHTDSSIQMPHRQTKKTQLALCLNYPFASGSVFKHIDSYSSSNERYVLIPLNQGLFLNCKRNFESQYRSCLNPFGSGSVFKRKCSRTKYLPWKS